MSWKALRFLTVTFLAFLLGRSAHATTYYVDYVNGSDSNNGTSKTTPWKHAPGMLGLTPAGASTGDACASICASTTIKPGDSVILKGGVVWPYTTAPWTWSWSGSSSTSTYGCQGTGCIYVGNAVGAGLPAWNSGTVASITLKRDLGGWNPASPPSISCSGGGGSGVAATPQLVPAAQTDSRLSGLIYYISMTSSGSGYTSAPSCSLSGGSGTATLAADIDRAIFDLGATQGSPPDWPTGQCGSYSTTCNPGLNITGSYVLASGIEVRNERMQQNTFGGVNDEHMTMVGLGSNDTASNLYVHGLFLDCYYAGSCNTSLDSQFDAISIGSPYAEAANNIVTNGDTAFLGTSGQQSNGICSLNNLCSSVSFGIVTGTQTGQGPASVHGNVEYVGAWQLRLVGNNTSGSTPYLSYNNEFWLTTQLINTNSHQNSRYMQLVSPATLISYNNIVHNQYSGTSSQIQCPSGVTFYFFNEVTWMIGTGTQAYSLDMNDVSGTGGCSLYLYNDTMYANNADACVSSQSGSNVTTIVMQNLHCITTPTAYNPFWSTATNSTYENYAGSTTAATVQASSVVQSVSTATSQGYAMRNLYAPTLSSNSTVTFASGGTTANLTNLCVGYLVPLCSDINGNSRPSSGGWQGGAYQFTGSSSAAPAPPTSLLASVN